jgi:6-phosphogluconolactonase (cycloisomerase 2 family)
MARNTLLLQLMKRMAEVGVESVYIPTDSKGQKVYGYTYADGSIKVNPIVSVVDTVIHELLHSLNPAYSEATVRQLTGKLLRGMSDAEVLAFYGAFQHKTQASE